MKCIFYWLLLGIVFFSCDSQDQSAGEPTNKLINESSPYLLQHAHNPVDWYPWGEEAMKKAKEEDKLMIISIGYSACHWCHVMEEESFSDSTVAAEMNANYVAIKVDREERPDIDQIYMDAAHLTSGNGGWPLNAIALPDGKPIFAATYFPKENWLKLLNYFQRLKLEEPEKLTEQAEKLTEGLNQLDDQYLSFEESEFTKDESEQMISKVLEKMDRKKGGKKGAPKFPLPGLLNYLSEYAYMQSNQDAMETYILTLDKMAAGGIYDHLGGGFARYSTDEDWLVPHFEKMLYDNAQLMSSYSNAFKITGNNRYREVIEETFNFLEKEFSDPSGGYYSSLNADSEGEEGKFYVWSGEEINEIIDSEVIMHYYGITDDGNFEGKNILNRKFTEEEVSAKFDLPADEVKRIIQTGKEKLKQERDKRIKPSLDNKILTSWNALTAIGLMDAYEAFNENKYLNRAKLVLEFIEKQQYENDGLYRSWKEDQRSVPGFLDDYAFTILSYIKMYENTFNENWLKKADQLKNYALDHFFDPASKTFFYAADYSDELIARRRQLVDHVIPSSNAAMSKSLFLLGHYLYDPDQIELSKNMVRVMKDDALNDPAFYTYWARLYNLHLNEFYEVAIVGDAFENKRAELASAYLPNILLMGGRDEGSLELLKNKKVEGSTLIYVCQNKSCKLPVKEVKAALKQIQ
ncbi:MAG TPA: thioredoxin domain-containing protein [Cyclobacteriaceae bacterium]